MTRPLLVYLSHADSDEDRALRERIVRALKPLVSKGLIRIQHRDIGETGEDREALIGPMVAASDIFIPFLNMEYLGDDLVDTIELPTALRCLEQKTLKVWPLHAGVLPNLKDHPTQRLARLNGFPRRSNVTLDSFQTKHQLDEQLVALAEELEKQCIRPTAQVNADLRAQKRDMGMRHVCSSELGEIANRFALIIGINKFPDAPTLKYCRADAQAIEQKLKGLGYTVRSLFDDHPDGVAAYPNKQLVLNTLSNICKTAGERDLIFVHISTHGDLLGGQAFLLAADSLIAKPEETGIPLAVVDDLLLESRARRIVVSLDACHSGFDRRPGQRALGEPPPSVSDFYKNFYSSAEGYAVIAACTADQVAYEDEQSGHGVYTRYLLEALDGLSPAVADGSPARDKGFVTLNDVKEYVLVRMRRWCVENGRDPQELNVRSQMIGDLILADYHQIRLPPRGEEGGPVHSVS